VVEFAPAGGGQPVTFRRPPTADVLPGLRGVRFSVAHLDQGIEMAPYTGSRQTQLGTDLTGGDRPGFHQQPHHSAAGTALVNSVRLVNPARRSSIGHHCSAGGHPGGFCSGFGWGFHPGPDFHNTSVTQFRRWV
jgi:hypothetical protein